MKFENKVVRILNYFNMCTNTSEDKLSLHIKIKFGITGHPYNIVEKFWSEHKTLINSEWAMQNPNNKEPLNNTRPSKRKHKNKRGNSSFYMTPEWREIRKNSLKIFGRRCMCCGNTPKKLVNVHVDHIKPRSTHPELQLEYSNVQILCKDCNEKKSNKYSTDYRKDYEKVKMKDFCKNNGLDYLK